MSQKQTKKKRDAAKNRIAHLIPDIPLKGSKNADGNFELPLETGKKNQKLFFKVPAELAQQIVDYIQLKPYVEVHALLGGLMRCEKIKE